MLLQDLCNARQAARLFDRASRLETDSFSALKLRPDSILSGHYAPDFSRFPLLARLYLKDPYNQRAPDQLRWCFAVADRPSPRRDAACAVLAALGELDGRDWGISGPTDLATVLRHMPGITSLRLNLCTQSAEEALTRLAILPALVPRIERLELLPSCMGRVESDFDKHCARIIGSLPCLRLLLMGSFKDASVLATLPCSRLTSLEFAVETCQHWPPLGCDVGLPWPHLRELRGIDLPAGDWAERLALGLPHLTLLVAEPSGDWGTHAPAAFPKVRAAMFTFCQRGFRRLCLRSLVPDVDFLEVMFDDDAVLVEISTTALSGLTRLSHLAYDNMHKGFLPLWLCEWEALAAAPHLTELKCDVSIEDLARLAKVTGLESLHLTVALSCEVSLHGRLNVVWGNYEGSTGVDLGAVASALACMPKLKRLALDVPGGRKDVASLVSFAEGLRGVTCLRLASIWTAEQLCIFVSRLKAPLRTLWLQSVPSTADAPDFAWLLNEQAERGLIIQGPHDVKWHLHPAHNFFTIRTSSFAKMS
jgi:hypothetical protein